MHNSTASANIRINAQPKLKVGWKTSYSKSTFADLTLARNLIQKIEFQICAPMAYNQRLENLYKAVGEKHTGCVTFPLASVFTMCAPCHGLTICPRYFMRNKKLLACTVLTAESNGKLPHLFIPSKTATLVPEFAVEDLPLGRTAAMVPEFAVKDLSLGTTPC